MTLFLEENDASYVKIHPASMRMGGIIVLEKGLEALREQLWPPGTQKN